MTVAMQAIWLLGSFASSLAPTRNSLIGGSSDCLKKLGGAAADLVSRRYSFQEKTPWAKKDKKEFVTNSSGQHRLKMQTHIRCFWEGRCLFRGQWWVIPRTSKYWREMSSLECHSFAIEDSLIFKSNLDDAEGFSPEVEASPLCFGSSFSSSWQNGTIENQNQNRVKNQLSQTSDHTHTCLEITVVNTIGNCLPFPFREQLWSMKLL